MNSPARIEKDPLTAKIRSALADLESVAELMWHGISSQAESPIELMLLEEIFTDYIGVPRYGKTEGLSLLGDYDHRAARRLDHGILVYPQAEIGAYRADFLFDVLMPGEGRQLWVVECDGHAFHHASKEQVERDKRRDRDMAAEGILILRYAGSEIYRNPEIVWRDIIHKVTGGRGPGWARLIPGQHG